MHGRSRATNAETKDLLLAVLGFGISIFLLHGLFDVTVVRYTTIS